MAIRALLAQLVHLPGGYGWWHSLPRKGKKAAPALIRRWARLLSDHCYPLSLRQAMLYACLNQDGVPDERGMQLYLWVLRNVYRGNAVSMHQQWQHLHNTQVALQQQRQLRLIPKVKPVVLKPMPTKGMGTWHTYPPTPASHSISGTPTQQYYNTSPTPVVHIDTDQSVAVTAQHISSVSAT